MPFKKFGLSVAAALRGFLKVLVRIGRSPRKEAESRQVFHPKVQVHHRTPRGQL